MQIVISKHAIGTILGGNKYWPYIMEMIQGETLKVETNFLFNDQFNTAQISYDRFQTLWNKLIKNHNFKSSYKQKVYDKLFNSLAELGIRVMESNVDKVIGDIRPFYYKCKYCGHNALKHKFFISKDSFTTSCPKCNKAGYVISIESLHIKRYKKQLAEKEDKSIHTFYCYHCNRVKSYKSQYTTGYAKTEDNEKYCYNCMAVVDSDYMLDNDKITLYLTYNNRIANYLRDYKSKTMYFKTMYFEQGAYVSNWCGTLKIPCHIQFTRNGHNWGLNRYDMWFYGPDSKVWHGVQYGDNTQLVHCKRTKLKSIL